MRCEVLLPSAPVWLTRLSRSICPAYDCADRLSAGHMRSAGEPAAARTALRRVSMRSRQSTRTTGWTT